MIATKKLKITKDLIGRYIRIRFDDIGCADGVCVGVKIEKNYKKLSFMTLAKGDELNTSIEEDQIVAIGSMVKVPVF